MTAVKATIYAVRYLFLDLLKDFIYFPIWWYTSGLLMALRFFGRGVSIGNKRLGLTILFRYWFKPMYGQTDWQGKIISFFMRTAHLFWHIFLMIIWMIAMLIILLLYIGLPIFTVYQIIGFYNG